MELQRAARRLGAISLVAGPLAVVVGSYAEPASYDEPVARILDEVAAHPGAQQLLIACDLLALLLLPAVICQAWLAHGRAPRLALWGGTLAVLGWLAGATMYAATDTVVLQAARLPDRAAAAQLLEGVLGHPVLAGLLVVTLLGSVLGTVVLGVGLWRARAIPRWAAACVGVAPLLQVAAHGIGNAAGAAAYAVGAVGALACAVALLRGRGAEQAQAVLGASALAGHGAGGR